LSEEGDFAEEQGRRRRGWEKRMKETFSKLKHPRLRILVENYYDIQKIRMALSNRAFIYDKFKMLTPAQSAALVQTVAEFKAEEKRIAKLIEEEIKGHPLWIGWLSGVKGVGSVMAAGLIAWIDDPGRFPTVSKLWAYSVGKPGERIRRGQKVGYNPRLKTHCWRVASQMLKARGPYADLYHEFKSTYSQREDLKQIKKGAYKLHIHLMALRKMIKVFLCHLWVRWREIEGLPVSKPYAIDKLGHKGYIEPLTDET